MVRGTSAVVCTLVAWVALAAAAPPDSEADARKAFEEGQKYYNLGKFERAIELYEKAYELTPKAGLLFNIAQAHRLNKTYERARFFYQSFLRNMPDAVNRAEVEERIAEMTRLIEAQPKEPQPSVEPQPSSSPVPVMVPTPEVVARTVVPESGPGVPEAPRDRSRPIYKKWWFWAGVSAVVIGATVVALTVPGGGSDAPDSDFGIRKLVP